MKVSFLKAPIGGIIGLEMITFVEPLGLECVAGAIELEGHECQIVDLRIDGVEAGLAKVRAFEPEIVGLQCNFTTERFRLLRLAERVRREFPQALVVVGGHDTSRDPEWFARPSIDVLAVGDGEEIMPALVAAYGRGDDLKDVPGLAINTSGGLVRTGAAPARRNIDELPMPARHLIADYAGEYYINFRRPLALMETARGCPFKCNFCSVWKFHESTFREKSPDRVVAELAAIEAPNVFITDDIFWMNVKRGRELAAAIKASGIKKHYTIQTRSDIITRFPELIEQWKECGRMTVFLGLEKIDDAGLSSVNKSNTAANNDLAIEILQDLDIGYTPNFIIDPGWEHADFDKLKRWIDRTGAYNSGFSVLTPLPGTDLWDEVVDDVNTRDWELYDITHSVLPTKMPLPEFYAELAGLWRHTMKVRYETHGRLKVNLGLLAALATGKVTLGAMRKGMRMGTVLGRAETFLKAHRDSAGRLAEAAELLATG
ncbi:MAG: cobalamin-dependent protein [Acidobacteriota bacterium]|nr:cobalamin-dependent protein [Acidobacteriota bacterium]MDH3523362.1 cobalamin-dependent protein [Acidobacteriota bacterium]